MRTFRLAWSITVSLFAFTFTPMARSAELPPAADVIKKVEAPQSSAKGDQANDPVAALKSDIKALSVKVATMPPAEAASEWLKLFDRYGDVPHSSDGSTRSYTRWRGSYRIRQSVGGASGVTFAELLAALPPPAGWEELAKAIDSRPMPAGE